jgi:lipid II:glycine glycyltransferase (peptidoglycan interpeptide bridge formation enzyme)
MNITAKEIEDKNLWEKFILDNPSQTNFLQSWYWGECHRLLQQKIFRLGFFNGDELCGVALLIMKESKRGAYLECPGGPIIDWQDENLFRLFIKTCKEIGFESGCIFVRIRPQIVDDKNFRQLFSKNGFIKSPMHLHAQDTWVLDITRSEEELFSGMRKTTRYMIRRAMKEKVSIIVSEDLKDITSLYNLQEQTAKRHKFIPFSLKFFQSHFSAFLTAGKIKIFKAFYQEKLLSIAMIVFYGNRAVYHYSASSDEFSNIGASYLLQWEVIKYAKKQGMKLYDFWGIAPNDNPKHRFAGVTLFKKGFGGIEVRYLPAHDLPLRWLYWFTYLFETIRRKIRHL